MRAVAVIVAGTFSRIHGIVAVAVTAGLAEVGPHVEHGSREVGVRIVDTGVNDCDDAGGVHRGSVPGGVADTRERVIEALGIANVTVVGPLITGGISGLCNIGRGRGSEVARCLRAARSARGCRSRRDARVQRRDFGSVLRIGALVVIGCLAPNILARSIGACCGAFIALLRGGFVNLVFRSGVGVRCSFLTRNVAFLTVCCGRFRFAQIIEGVLVVRAGIEDARIVSLFECLQHLLGGGGFAGDEPNVNVHVVCGDDAVFDIEARFRVLERVF